MDNNEKKSPLRKIILAVVIIAVAAAVLWWVIPVSLFPKEYSEMTIGYVRIDGVTYEPRDGWPSEEQLAQIESILKPLKMTCAGGYDIEEAYNCRLYIPFYFKNEKGVIFHSGCLIINQELKARSRIPVPFDINTNIENGDGIYQQIMDVLGTPPKK